MVAKTTEIEHLFLSGYGMIGKNNDLDVTGLEKYRLIQAAYHGNVEEVNKMLKKKGKYYNTKLSFPLNFFICVGVKCRLSP